MSKYSMFHRCKIPCCVKLSRIPSGGNGPSQLGARFSYQHQLRRKCLSGTCTQHRRSASILWKLLCTAYNLQRLLVASGQQTHTPLRTPSLWKAQLLRRSLLPFCWCLSHVVQLTLTVSVHAALVSLACQEKAANSADVCVHDLVTTWSHAETE